MKRPAKGQGKSMAQETVIKTQKKKKTSGVTKHRRLFIALMLAYPILHFLVFWVYINFNTFLISFQNFSFKQGKEIWTGWDNYAYFFKELTKTGSQAVRYAIVNSVLFLIFNNFILLPLSIVCAYLFFKKVFGHRVFRVIFFLPNIISIVVLTMCFQFMFNSQFGPVVRILEKMGLSSLVPPNGYFGTKGLSQAMIFLYCLWAGIGYNVLLLSGAISRVPTEVLEAGKIDGIGMGREMCQVIIPLIFPTISTLFITGSMVMFTLYLQPMLLTAGGPNNSTFTIAYYVVEYVNNNKLYEAATAGIVFSLIGIPLVQLIKWGMEKITPQVEF